METIRSTIASAARPLRGRREPYRPHKERKDMGDDGYVEKFIRFSSFGCELYRFMCVSHEKCEKNIDGGLCPHTPVGITAAAPVWAPRGGFHYHFSKMVIALPCPARDAGGQNVLKDIPLACVFHRFGANPIGSCQFLQSITMQSQS